MMWSATRPKVEGWFVWREDIEEAPTLIQVWMAKKRRGNGSAPPRYGWHVGTWLGKLMHEEEPHELDALGGEFLKGDDGPIQIELPGKGDTIATEQSSAKKPPKAPRRKGKAKHEPSEAVREEPA